MSFFEKYSPSTISDVIGNKNQIDIIKNWLVKYEINRKICAENPKRRKKNTPQNEGGTHSCLFVVGDHGVGKTCVVKLLLNKHNYSVHNVNLSQIGTNKNKNVDEVVDKILNMGNIFDNLAQENTCSPVILVDEIESANSQVEKNFIASLVKKNEEKWICPIIFISNGKHSKTTTYIKKNSNIVTFTQPTIENMKKILLRICAAEKMKLDNVKSCERIVEHSQRDIRRLISTLQDLKTNFGKTRITATHIEEYFKSSKQKDSDIHIYKATADMIVDYKSINDCLRLYVGERVIIPLVMHQNYIKCLSKYRPDNKQTITLASDISSSIAMGDVIENYIYSDQNWDMQEVHGFMSCVYPSYKMSNEKINSNVEMLAKYLDFPVDLNRTSIKRINYKNVANSNACLKNLDVTDFIMLNKLIRKLLAENKIEECVELFRNYNIGIDGFESVLKIDKINDTKTILPTQTRKKIIQLLDDNTQQRNDSVLF